MSNFLILKARLFFKTGLFLSALLLPTASALGEESGKITEIYIVTPEWEDQTNKDGTGLFFDLIRKVYEPFGIKMTYDIVPWKRAVKMINEKTADAMLCARKRKGRLIPKYPMVVEHTTALFRKDSIKEWRGIDTLDGKRAVWMRGYDFHADEKLKHLTLKWDEVDTQEQAWKLIKTARYDFYIDVLIDMELYIRKHMIDMSPYQIEIIKRANAYMSFAKTEKSEKLIKIYDERIIELFKSGELEKMYKKWNVRFSPQAWENK